MRYLGYYRGRTDGVFSDALKAAVVAFQIQSSVIPQVLATGAGRVGPATQTAILKAWKVKQVAEKSRTTLTKMQVKAKIQTTLVPSRVLARGDRGTSVKLLQRLLRESGYLKDTDVTGLYGDRTERAIIAYQQDRKIISSAKDHGAGVFGPATRQMLLSDAVNAQLKKIRYEGV
jgi:peptidoglycan hydrolase-like protein with peptidoglycan-binding domain